MAFISPDNRFLQFAASSFCFPSPPPGTTLCTTPHVSDCRSTGPAFLAQGERMGAPPSLNTLFVRLALTVALFATPCDKKGRRSTASTASWSPFLFLYFSFYLRPVLRATILVSQIFLFILRVSRWTHYGPPFVSRVTLLCELQGREREQDRKRRP